MVMMMLMMMMVIMMQAITACEYRHQRIFSVLELALLAIYLLELLLFLLDVLLMIALRRTFDNLLFLDHDLVFQFSLQLRKHFHQDVRLLLIHCNL